MATTTVQLRSETKKILDDLKQNPRETYDDVVTRLAARAYDDEPRQRRRSQVSWQALRILRKDVCRRRQVRDAAGSLMAYMVIIPNHAKKQLQDLPPEQAIRILDAIEGFTGDLDYVRYDVRKVKGSPENTRGTG